MCYIQTFSVHTEGAMYALKITIIDMYFFTALSMKANSCTDTAKADIWP